MRVFYEQINVGSAKYLVSFHDGKKTHDDGSAFYDVKIFTNRRAKEKFILKLINIGYTERTR
jgi:hypothetical protein